MMKIEVVGICSFEVGIHVGGVSLDYVLFQ